MTKRYNLFIDGQNVPSRFIDQIIQYCESLGLPQEEARLYTSSNEIAGLMSNWSTVLADYDIDLVPVRCKPRKNSVDIRLAVDVIDSACEEKGNDVIIVVTNDSDFTHVASKVISYKAEFHLLYTEGNQPSGYSPKTIMVQLRDERTKGRKIAEGVRAAASHLPGKESVKVALRSIVAPFAAKQDYASDIPLAQLNGANFARRILEVSPVAIDSRELFRAWKDVSGRAWKPKGSKKSPQQFLDQNFPNAEYRFIEWDGLPINQGYFLHWEHDALEVAAGWRNPLVSVLGIDHDLLAGQCAIIAKGLQAAAYENFNFLYDSYAEENLLPRYGAWAIVHCWLSKQANGDTNPNWQAPIPQFPSVSSEQLRTTIEAEVRRQFECGELALVASQSFDNDRRQGRRSTSA